jgi:hypothetical protein
MPVQRSLYSAGGVKAQSQTHRASGYPVPPHAPSATSHVSEKCANNPPYDAEQLTGLINLSEHTFDILMNAELINKNTYPSGRLS